MTAGLLATAVARPLVMLLDGTVVVPGVVFTLIPLLLAGLVWSQKPALLIVATVLSAVFLIGALRAPLVQTRIAHPEAKGYFLVALLELVGGATATLCGGSAVLKYLRAR